MKLPKGFVEYQEADLRFTGWEHECIIIDRTENHYFIPQNRYDELMTPNKPIERDKTGWGISGCSGIGGTIHQISFL